MFIWICQRKLCFWVCAGRACLISKHSEMKPKTQEKLTKHTSPRWLMGREKWPVDQHHRRPHSDAPCLRADPHLLDITSRKSSVCPTYVRDGWSYNNMARPVTEWHLSLCSLPLRLQHGRLPMWQVWCQACDEQATHYFVMPLWCQSLAGSFYSSSNHRCNSLIIPSYTDASEGHKKKSASDSERNVRL